tara:strand:- start:1185 stop:1349 length:165 start_codon:yes stop_codon:yes gene_type:complete
MLESQVDLLQALIPFIKAGLIAGVVVAVLVGAAKLGYRFAPYIVIFALIMYLFF